MVVIDWFPCRGFCRTRWRYTSIITYTITMIIYMIEIHSQHSYSLYFSIIEMIVSFALQLDTRNQIPNSLSSFSFPDSLLLLAIVYVW